MGGDSVCVVIVCGWYLCGASITTRRCRNAATESCSVPEVVSSRGHMTVLPWNVDALL